MSVDLTNFAGRDRMNDRLVREVVYTGPAAYAAGGDATPPADLGLGTIYGVYGNISNGSAMLLSRWDYTNQKLMFFVPNTGAEATGNLSTYSGTLLFTGK